MGSGRACGRKWPMIRFRLKAFDQNDEITPTVCESESCLVRRKIQRLGISEFPSLLSRDFILSPEAWRTFLGRRKLSTPISSSPPQDSSLHFPSTNRPICYPIYPFRSLEINNPSSSITVWALRSPVRPRSLTKPKDIVSWSCLRPEIPKVCLQQTCRSPNLISCFGAAEVIGVRL